MNKQENVNPKNVNFIRFANNPATYQNGRTVYEATRTDGGYFIVTIDGSFAYKMNEDSKMFYGMINNADVIEEVC